MFKNSLLLVMLAAFVIFAANTVKAQPPIINDGLAPAVTDLYVNPGGLGDALIFGYYNVKGGNLNFLRIVNTSINTGIGGKIRFREGKDSNEVLNFFVCLSAGDQWSAWIVDGGTGQPAVLYYYDNDTPTTPDPQRDNNATNNFLATESFVAEQPTSVTMEDTKEGYFEFIANTAWADTPGASKVVKTPNECRDKVLGRTGYDAPNTLFGNHYIFDIANGGTYAYNATAIGSFLSNHVQGSLAADSDPKLNTNDPGDPVANLTKLNFVLTKSIQYATYDLEFNGGTTIINTFPTKVLSGTGTESPFNKDNDGSTRCESAVFTLWNNKEESETFITAPIESVSPRPHEIQFGKCNEVSLAVIGTSTSPVLSSGLVDMNLPNAEFTLGWVSEDFVTGFPARKTCVEDVCAMGLPVISYETQGFLNGFFTQMLPLRFETFYKN